MFLKLDSRIFKRILESIAEPLKSKAYNDGDFAMVNGRLCIYTNGEWVETRVVDNLGGGSGGTSNYNLLSNRPKINGVLLSGDKSSTDFGLADSDDITDLQSQIDAITSSTDVRDVVADYAALQSYDTSVLYDKDIVKVLSDSTHASATAYYRWVITGNAGAWAYIGSEGPHYTKSETDTAIATAVNTATAGLPTDVLVNGTSVVDENGDANIPAIPQIDANLNTTGKAADAKATGDAIANLKGTAKSPSWGSVSVNWGDIVEYTLSADGTLDVTVEGLINFPDNRIIRLVVNVDGENANIQIDTYGGVSLYWANGDEPTYESGKVYEIILSQGFNMVFASYTEYTLS